MPASPTDEMLDSWLDDVRRRARHRRIIDRTARDGHRGILTLPTRFFFKIAEVGPARAFSLAAGVVGARLGIR